MTTEQTGRQDIDSTDSQARIEPTTLVASPPGGDPTPLPRRRAAHGTRTGMRAAPPPIPDGTRPKLAAAPPRASSKPLPPPDSFEAGDRDRRSCRRHDGRCQQAGFSPLPDPDGWSLPATIEPSSGPSYPSVYHPEPAAPDVTVLTGVRVRVRRGAAGRDPPPSRLPSGSRRSTRCSRTRSRRRRGRGRRARSPPRTRTRSPRPRATSTRPTPSHAPRPTRSPAPRPRSPRRRSRARARKASESDADGDTDKSADAEAEAVALAKANAAANASLPKLPSARPSNAKLPPPRAALGGTHVRRSPRCAPLPPRCSRRRPTRPRRRSSSSSISSPSRRRRRPRRSCRRRCRSSRPPVGPRKPVNPLVAAAQASMDVDIDWDVREPGDMTSAHTTELRDAVKSKMPNARCSACRRRDVRDGRLPRDAQHETPKHTPVRPRRPAAETPAPAPEAPAAPAQVRRSDRRPGGRAAAAGADRCTARPAAGVFDAEWRARDVRRRRQGRDRRPHADDDHARREQGARHRVHDGRPRDAARAHPGRRHDGTRRDAAREGRRVAPASPACRRAGEYRSGRAAPRDRTPAHHEGDDASGPPSSTS